MRRLLLIVLAGSSPITVAQAAAGQSSATGPDPVVTGDNRVICRRVTRTATRMRTGRICRTQSQWAQEAGRRTPDPDDPNATIDGVDASLAMLGANEASTNDSGGMGREHDTPLGPR
jgi:hypothetical protein